MNEESPHIEGFVNKDKNLGFSAGIYNDHWSASLSWDDDNLAPEAIAPYKNKTIEEIETEEATK